MLNRCINNAVVIELLAAALLGGAAVTANAQENAAGTAPIPAAQVYDRSAMFPTNLSGITTFADPPAGFNPVAATPEQRAQYGFPPAPDQAADPNGYAAWKKAMSAAAHAKHWKGPLKITNLHSTPARIGSPPAGAAASIEGGPTTNGTSYNWSGIVNTNTNTSFTSAAFNEVWSEFTVPSAQEPYGVCDNSQTYYAAVWNGIDGWSNGDVLQAGTLSYATCSGGVNQPGYCAWIEWYPSYPILGEYDVNPGDVMYVETYATSATRGYLYVYDYALQIFASYSLTPTGSTRLIGNSAEYIVERICCDSAGYNTALANYLISPAWGQYNYNRRNVLRYTGNTNPSTIWVSMLDDPGDQYISAPYAVGVVSPYSATAEAVTIFQSQNCAFSGGCTQN